jgi:hypothetical protein
MSKLVKRGGDATAAKRDDAARKFKNPSYQLRSGKQRRKLRRR